jgi:hypothetical protein
VCLTCGEKKSDDLMLKNSDFCKICRRKETSAKYRKNNKDKINDYCASYREKNRERLREYNRKWMKERYHIYKIWVENNKDRVNEIKRKHEINKNANNEIYKLTRIIRNSIRSSIRSRNFKKRTKTSEILGCSMQEFMVYIESTFQDGMSFDNYGDWHLDHIIPISRAKSYEEAIELNHYTNFQALWKIDNLRKYNKFYG